MQLYFRVGDVQLGESWIGRVQWGGGVTEQGWGVVHDKLLQKGSPLSVSGSPPPHTHLLGSQCLLAEERRLSMPETGEKEMNYLLKSYTDLE